MSHGHLIVLLAGIIGGLVNAAAGGGMFIIFPLLLFLGVPAISANATTTIAIFPGTLATAFSYRKALPSPKLTIGAFAMSIVGGTIGALLLLWISNRVFDHLAPYLMLMATILFTASPWITKWVRQSNPKAHPSWIRYPLLGLLLVVCVYGGFFGAGMGIMTLATLTLMGQTNIHQMNALRTIIGLGANVVALALFSRAGLVQWDFAVFLAIGALMGGISGSLLFRTLSHSRMNRIVVSMAWILTITIFLMR